MLSGQTFAKSLSPTANTADNVTSPYCAGVLPLQPCGNASAFPVSDIVDGKSVCAPLTSTADNDANSDSQNDWLYLGTARVSTESSPLPVYFKVIDNLNWQLKICGLLKSDILATLNLNTAKISIPEQMTATPSDYAGSGEDYYDCYAISAELSGTPFDGTLDFPMYLKASPSISFKVGGNPTISFNISGWETYGTVTPNDVMVSTLSVNDMNISSDPCDVLYKKFSDNIWIFMLQGFMGGNIPIVSYLDSHISVSVNTNTSHTISYGLTVDGGYSTYHIFGYFLGSPRDGEMWYPIWQYVAPNYGRNFTNYRFILNFKSQLTPVFAIDNAGMPIYSAKDAKSIKLPVSHSSNVAMASVTVEYCDADGTYELFKGREPIADDNTILIDLPRGRGVYQVKALGIDEHGEFGNVIQKTLIMSNYDADHTWSSIGTGLFKPNLFTFCWPGKVAPWLETEIQKADDTDGLYRLVNPFKRKEVTDFGFEFNNDMDFYIYFGYNCDYSVFQIIGDSKAPDPYAQWMYFHSRAVDTSSDAEGRYMLNLGDITLPGVENIDIVFSSENTACVTPYVKSLRYCVVPAALAEKIPNGTDAAAWLKSGEVPCLTVEPDAAGIVTFDRSYGNNALNLLAIALLDDKQNERNYAYYLSTDEAGWTPVGHTDMSTFAKTFTDKDIQIHPEVRVNPFDHNIVQIVNPMKPLDGKLGADYRTDFTQNRHLYLCASKAGVVYMSDPAGVPLVDMTTFSGISYAGEVDFSYNYTEEEEELLRRYSFDCTTNASYRGGYSDSDILELVAAYNDPYPLHYGHIFVLPTASLFLNSYAHGGMGPSDTQMIVYAPGTFGRDHSISVDNATAEITVGADIAKIRICISEVYDESLLSIANVLRDENIGTTVTVGAGKRIPLSDRPGYYFYSVVGYDADGEVANAVTGSAQVLSAIDIISDTDGARPEYYNLQGIRIDNPQKGSVVIRRQGPKTSKIIIR